MKIFITGSADGLGQMAAQLLTNAGHEVVVHGRNEKRATEALASVPGAVASVHGDLSSLAEMKSVARQADAVGQFDAVIHNAAVGYREPHKVTTADGLPEVFAVNALAPYVLTCLMQKPKRLIYITSGLQQSGNSDLSDLAWDNRKWNGFQAYSDSKLHNVMLAFAVARLWTDVYANAVEPGWVATKMGGPGAPDSLKDGPATQAWLASSDEQAARVSGKCFYHKRIKGHNPAADNITLQDQFLAMCEKLSGVKFIR